MVSHEERSIWSRAKEWTLQEFLAVSYPYWVLAGDFLILLVYCYEQDMTVLIYAAMPETMKSVGWFALLFVLEVNLHAYSLSSLSLIFQLVEVHMENSEDHIRGIFLCV